jgi:hypothetical protein
MVAPEGEPRGGPAPSPTLSEPARTLAHKEHLAHHELEAEVDTAVELLRGMFFASLRHEQLAAFLPALRTALLNHVQGHVYWTQSWRGSAYRAIGCHHGRQDPLLLHAAATANCERALALLPSDWTMWLDPGCVAVRICDQPLQEVRVSSSRYSPTNDVPLAMPPESGPETTASYDTEAMHRFASPQRGGMAGLATDGVNNRFRTPARAPGSPSSSEASPNASPEIWASAPPAVLDTVAATAAAAAAAEAALREAALRAQFSSGFRHDSPPLALRAPRQRARRRLKRMDKAGQGFGDRKSVV